MCGIFGYIGPKKIDDMLINGLLRLEYRGYDSAGIAVLTPQLRVIKAKGNIAALQEKIATEKPISGTIGIAHTRWATHGEPNERNAHPHTCDRAKLAIVHNGIIENYHALQQHLIAKGHSFTSDTDSELIAHLISENKNNTGDTGDLFLAFQKSLTMLEGTYGIAVLQEGTEEILVGRNGSPLIIGIGKGEMYVASDAAAIVEHTKKVITINDKEAARITRTTYTITDLSNQEAPHEVENISWDFKQIKLAGHDHFMHKEIFEQPATIKDAFRGRLTPTGIKLDGLREIKTKHTFSQITLLACGTSYYASQIGEYLLENLAKIPSRARYASEFRYSNPVIVPHELVIGVSQSGETADTLAALKLARQTTKTFGIVNAVGSIMTKETDAGIYIHAGPEIGVASTKAFTGQVTVLYLLAVQLAVEKGLLSYEAYRDALEDIPQKVETVLNEEAEIKRISTIISKHDNALYLGRGIDYPVAMEGALKLKEISGIHAEGYPAAEMKHGPIALIDENMPVIFIATGNDHIFEKILSNMQEVKARRGLIIAIANHKDARLSKLADHVILVPKTIEELSPLINVIPLQMIAYHAAVIRGKNPDKPKNLAKAVTVE
jgi:glucosamine--fructose-6-phosphate aminotransferase (isomerizing)